MNFQNMATSTKRSTIVTVGFAVVALALYFVAVEPTEIQLDKARKTLRSTNEEHHKMSADLARADRVQHELAKAQSSLADYSKALIVPLLESTAMRAKSIVDPIATACGLFGTEYEALPALDLPVIKETPTQRYVRCPIRLTCKGSYQGAISFVRCVEREFPLIALESLTIESQNEPDHQRIVIVLEWPMKKTGGMRK